jgi:2'-5' RNA ligase
VKRLFIAVDPDGETREAIGRLSESLRLACPRASWVAADRLHLTLEFLGAVDAGDEKRARSAVGQPIPIAPFRLSFHGLGFFPAYGAPRVLWLGVQEGLDSMRSLHGVVCARLGTTDPGRSPFTPHLTLARFRDRPNRNRANTVLAAEATAGPCAIDRVTLYESHLSPKGSVYVALAQARLTP